MPSESGEWSYGVVRDLKYLGNRKNKSKPYSLYQITHVHSVTSQPLPSETHFWEFWCSQGSLTWENWSIVACLTGVLWQDQPCWDRCLLEDCSEDRGVWTYSTPPWTFLCLLDYYSHWDFLSRNDWPISASPVFSNIVWPWAIPLSQYILFTSNGICFLKHTLRNADPWSR